MISFIRHISVRQWICIGIINLLIVAFFGLLMRLKIIFPITLFDQKNIMHAHSHFAFSGWISHMLMLLMAAVFLNKKADNRLPMRYQLLLFGNMIAAFGMLISFSWQGYKVYAIICSSLTLIISYVYIFLSWRDLNRSKIEANVVNWFKASLFFLFLSSIGTFYLVYLIKMGEVDPKRQLAAVYFFLHFQYNGWFFFSCMGLMSWWIGSLGFIIPHEKQIRQIFLWSCIPLFLLSVLWIDIPTWLYLLLICGVILQLVAWFCWLFHISRNRAGYRDKIVNVSRYLLVVVAIAGSIKFVLQTLSVIPSLSNIAYSFRPIVIGYLHLVLLGFITLFILSFIFQKRFLIIGPWINRGVILFVTGILFNEFFLLLQGGGGLINVYVPYLPVGLACAAACLVLALMLLVWSTLKHNKVT